MIEFKPAGKKINKAEKELLFSMGRKWCACCATTKLFEDFYKSSRTCKLCEKNRTDRWRSNNKNKFNETKRAWRKANAELNKGYDKKYRENNRKEIRSKERSIYQEKKASILKRKKSNYQKNKELLNSKRREKRKEQMKDPLFALSKRLRDRIRSIFRKSDLPKNSTTQKLLGCDWLSAKEHLENQFAYGMSWENIKEWHIDHIIPLCSASTEEELISLCHYTNLQPLWAFDNMSKGSSMPN